MKISIKDILIVVILILVILIVVLLLKNNQGGAPLESDIEIEYTTGGGGPGLQYDIDPVTVKLSSNKSEITYKNKVSNKITIDEEKYAELIELINNKFYKSDKDLSDKDVMDGGTSSITIKNKKTGKSYTVGGYGVDDDKFNEVEDKIREVIGEDTIYNFRKNKLKEYFGIDGE